MSSTSEIWELSSLAHKLKNIHDLLAAELDGCRKYIGKTFSIHSKKYKYITYIKLEISLNSTLNFSLLNLQTTLVDACYKMYVSFSSLLKLHMKY